MVSVDPVKKGGVDPLLPSNHADKQEHMVHVPCEQNITPKKRAFSLWTPLRSLTKMFSRVRRVRLDKVYCDSPTVSLDVSEKEILQPFQQIEDQLSRIHCSIGETGSIQEAVLKRERKVRKWQNKLKVLSDDISCIEQSHIKGSRQTFWKRYYQGILQERILDSSLKKEGYGKHKIEDQIYQIRIWIQQIDQGKLSGDLQEDMLGLVQEKIHILGRKIEYTQQEMNKLQRIAEIQDQVQTLHDLPMVDAAVELLESIDDKIDALMVQVQGHPMTFWQQTYVALLQAKKAYVHKLEEKS